MLPRVFGRAERSDRVTGTYTPVIAVKAHADSCWQGYASHRSGRESWIEGPSRERCSQLRCH
jgi:hypothetical protein